MQFKILLFLTTAKQKKVSFQLTNGINEAGNALYACTNAGRIHFHFYSLYTVLEPSADFSHSVRIKHAPDPN